ADLHPADRHLRARPADREDGGRPMSPLTRKRIGKAAANCAGIVVFLFAVFPVYWMIGTAFKPNDQIFTTEFIPFPSPPSLDHVERVFTRGVAGIPIWQYLLNSAIVALSAVVIGAVFALLAATAVSRFRFRFRTSFL